MCNNIKSKTLGVRIRSLLLVFLLIASVFTMVACDSYSTEDVVVTTEEFELVYCYIEYRNQTNGFGGITGTSEYLHYGYVDDNGQVIFDEMSFGNHLNFTVTEETSKIIITTTKNKTTYAFELTREMYNNLNSSQK